MRRKAVGPLRSLRRPKIRQDWSKWTLYNLSRFEIPRTDRDSYFQQKWKAKALTRGYHGEHIRTKAWNKMFSRSLPSVVPMDHRVLARSDGSDHAKGRGRGEEVDRSASPAVETGRSTKTRATPYMQMTFHPLERRLDTAIWRALFSSSVREARMMCTQGHVRVNGKKMLHPSYRLNPGDMFSVTPKVVMKATGAPNFYIGNENQVNKLKQRAEQELKDLRSKLSKASREAQEAAEAAAAEEDADADGEEANAKDDGLSPEEKAAKKTLRDMRKEIQAMLKDKQELSNRQKRMLRELRTDIPRMMSKKQFSPTDLSTAQQRFTEAASSTMAADVTDEADTSSSGASSGVPSNEEMKASSRALQDLRLQIRYLVDRWRKFEIESGVRRFLRLQYLMIQMMLAEPTLLQTRYADAVTDTVTKAASQYGVKLDKISKEAREEYRLTEWKQANPYDSSSPDAWRPRDYMSAFAFIPRYLEVNQNICSAVYLRHPVARPGLGEVPTPFPQALNQLAFNWFLRRR